MATDFSPIYALVRAHEKTADRTACVAVLRPSGCTHLPLRLHSAEAMQPADERYALLLVKTALWLQGGCGLVTEDEAVFRWLRAAYSPQGARAFDRSFMSGVYGRPFSVVLSRELPPACEAASSVSAESRGCRVGIDLGGSDRKAAAVMDGETVYTEEVVWQPKSAGDLRYHYEGITAALRAAKAHLPGVDAVGISTAGVVLEGEIRRSSLFMSVPAAEFDRCGRDILQRAARDVFGAVPCTVCNDGDVAALAGSIALGRRELLGIAMGTSEAGGYVDENGHITGPAGGYAGGDAPLGAGSGANGRRAGAGRFFRAGAYAGSDPAVVSAAAGLPECAAAGSGHQRRWRRVSGGSVPDGAEKGRRGDGAFPAGGISASGGAGGGRRPADNKIGKKQPFGCFFLYVGLYDCLYPVHHGNGFWGHFSV